MKLKVGHFYRWLDMLPERNHDDAIFKVMGRGEHRTHNFNGKRVIRWGMSYTIIYPFSRKRTGGQFQTYTVTEKFLDAERAGVVEWTE